MRHFALALVLAFVVSGTAWAGEIPTTGAPAPQQSTSVATTAGEIPTTGATAPEASSTVLTIILSLISIVP